VNLINRLNKFFGFDHNLFLLDESVLNHSRYIPKTNGNITPQTVYTFGNNSNLNVTNDIQWKQLKTLTKQVGHNKFVIVVAADLGSANNTQILDKVVRIQQVQKKVKIGIFSMKKKVE